MPGMFLIDTHVLTQWNLITVLWGRYCYFPVNFWHGIWHPFLLFLSVLSCFSRVRAFESLWTVVHQGYTSPPSVHRMLQARILKWVAFLSSRRSSWLRNQTCLFLHLLHCRWILCPLSHLGNPFSSQVLVILTLIHSTKHTELICRVFSRHSN